MTWHDLWHRITTTRYTILLEDEVDRLRVENRALMNSLLTRAGVQPIDVPQPVARQQRRMTRYQQQTQIEREAYKKSLGEVEKDARGASH